MIYIHNATLYTPENKIDHGALLVSGDVIAALGSEDELPCPPGAETIDVGGLSLVPGFIDLQINGAFGMDFTTSPATIWQVGEQLTQFGITSFLPTIISSPSESVRTAQSILQAGPPSSYRGARVLGLHLEGPYLNPEKCGAHEPCVPFPARSSSLSALEPLQPCEYGDACTRAGRLSSGNQDTGPEWGGGQCRSLPG